MEEKTKNQKLDQIEPTQLVRIWSDEYSHEHTVLGTFTSRTALGLYLVGLIEKETSASYSDLHDLYLKKIKIRYLSGRVLICSLWLRLRRDYRRRGLPSRLGLQAKGVYEI